MLSLLIQNVFMILKFMIDKIILENSERRQFSFRFSGFDCASHKNLFLPLKLVEFLKCQKLSADSPIGSGTPPAIILL